MTDILELTRELQERAAQSKAREEALRREYESLDAPRPARAEDVVVKTILGLGPVLFGKAVGGSRGAAAGAKGGATALEYLLGEEEKEKEAKKEMIKSALAQEMLETRKLQEGAVDLPFLIAKEEADLASKIQEKATLNALGLLHKDATKKGMPYDLATSLAKQTGVDVTTEEGQALVKALAEGHATLSDIAYKMGYKRAPVTPQLADDLSKQEMSIEKMDTLISELEKVDFPKNLRGFNAFLKFKKVTGDSRAALLNSMQTISAFEISRMWQSSNQISNRDFSVMMDAINGTVLLSKEGIVALARHLQRQMLSAFEHEVRANINYGNLRPDVSQRLLGRVERLRAKYIPQSIEWKGRRYSVGEVIVSPKDGKQYVVIGKTEEGKPKVELVTRAGE